MSFLNKIFGNKNKIHTSLVINDAYLEVAQLAGGRNKPELVGINRVELGEGVIKDGEIIRVTEFKDALQQLFKEASPNPIESESLCISMSFEQVYSFVKSFSKHTTEELMISELDELLENEAPFSLDELDRDYQQKTDGNKIYYGLTAYAKRWKKTVKDACNELGFEDLQFFPEPVTQISLAETAPGGDFVLFSWLNEHPYLSVFYHGLLYDSYLVKGEDLMKEFKKESQNFENEFGEPIKSVYFAGFPKSKLSEVKKIFDAEDLSVIYLRETDTPLAEVISVEEYSTTLVGLALMSLNSKL